MIFIDDTKTVLAGGSGDLICELARGINQYHESMQEHYDKQVADEVVVLMGRMAMGVKTKENAEALAEEFNEIIDMYEKRKVEK